jgi:Relaxase/Mobilisation nuclease domain
MVVRIKSPHSLQRALNYNEKKVQQEKAECIHAENYLLNPDQMNFYQKMERLQDLISLNERAKKSNTLHISLNFDPSEKFSQEKLTEIAKVYMEKIGFGEQPYLVYQHHDAGHPHLHILTTNIKQDGKRIDTYNIGRHQSEKARKEIEQHFGLIKAEGKKIEQAKELYPVNTQKVHYGKSETRRSITNVLDLVLNHFKYTSLPELNAVLKQYNVMADRGNEKGIIYKSNGLLYRLLDEKGNKIGVPVKASLIYSQPTLKNLEKKFEENELARQLDKKKLKTSIDWVLAKSPANLKQFIDELKKEKIQTIIRENKAGIKYGITFIDYRSKAVFNGSDLGKQYSIAGLQQKFGERNQKTDIKVSEVKPVISKNLTKEISREQDKDQAEKQNEKADLLKELITPEKTFQRLPYELIKKKKKKRNQSL